MRMYMVAGIALVVIGLFLLLGGSFTSRREVLRVGDVSVSAEEKRPVQPWVGGLAVVAGIALVATGARRRSAR
jgi:UDP-N-acetylmuramyl pentapeptide phosphotransferase/UDP-N-acetylglucosamine-1-phosphate transferase